MARRMSCQQKRSLGNMPALGAEQAPWQAPNHAFGGRRVLLIASGAECIAESLHPDPPAGCWRGLLLQAKPHNPYCQPNQWRPFLITVDLMSAPAPRTNAVSANSWCSQRLGTSSVDVEMNSEAPTAVLDSILDGNVKAMNSRLVTFDGPADEASILVWRWSAGGHWGQQQCCLPASS